MPIKYSDVLEQVADGLGNHYSYDDQVNIFIGEKEYAFGFRTEESGSQGECYIEITGEGLDRQIGDYFNRNSYIQYPALSDLVSIDEISKVIHDFLNKE